VLVGNLYRNQLHDILEQFFEDEKFRILLKDNYNSRYEKLQSAHQGVTSLLDGLDAQLDDLETEYLLVEFEHADVTTGELEAAYEAIHHESVVTVAHFISSLYDGLLDYTNGDLERVGFHPCDPSYLNF